VLRVGRGNPLLGDGEVGVEDLGSGRRRGRGETVGTGERRPASAIGVRRTRRDSGGHGHLVGAGCVRSPSGAPLDRKGAMPRVVEDRKGRCRTLLTGRRRHLRWRTLAFPVMERQSPASREALSSPWQGTRAWPGVPLFLPVPLAATNGPTVCVGCAGVPRVRDGEQALRGDARLM